MPVTPTTPILQFGTSRFLQAHADLFISEALARGQALGAITVVQSSGDGARSHRLAALADPAGYPVRVQGLVDGESVAFETRVSSVVRTLSTAADWPEVCRIAVEEAQIILSNTGDSGWMPQPPDGAAAFDQAMSYPAKLTHLLLARYRAGGRPVQVMPTELVARNGDKLRARVIELAAPLDAGFADWVGAQIFANSLVDRIVSEPLEPAGAVAEPYALWAIEECDGLVIPCTHPAVQRVAALDRIERLKLHVLNLGHTYLVSGWIGRGRAGAPLVRDLMTDATIRADLERVYTDEVLPTFAAWGIEAEARAYIATTLDRLANPFLEHRLSDIAQNHAEKVQRRIGAFLDWSETLGIPPLQTALRAVLAE